jgi:hypothetical protein
MLSELLKSTVFFVCGKFGGTIDAIMKDKIELYIYPSFFLNFILFCFRISITSFENIYISININPFKQVARFQHAFYL